MVRENVILEIKDIEKSYGKSRVLQNISFTIQQGEICGLIGENGAGKTTLMRIILGLIRADKGEVNISSDNKIGSIIESPALYPNLTGRQHLQYYKMKFNLDTDVEDVLKLVQLEPEAWDRKAKNYSLGMRQRLSIAIALLDNPQLIILDEPVNGLDPQGIAELRKLILYLREERGVTFLISSHILSELEFLVDRYIVMKKGKLVDSVMESSLSRYATEKVFIKTTDNSLLKMQLAGLSIAFSEKDGSLIIPDKRELTKVLEQILTLNLEIEDIYIQKETFEDYYLEHII